MMNTRTAISKLNQWPVTSEIVLRLIATMVLAFALFSMYNRNLPDYLAYESLWYNDEVNYGYSRVFYYIVQGFKYFGFSYEAFRFIVLIFGVAFFVLSAKSPKNGDRFSRNIFLFYVTFCLIIFSFIFEFYDVRLRAGISCLMFSLAFVPEINSSDIRNNVLLRAGQAFLLAGSLILHSSTFAAICLFCMPPMLYVKYAPDWVRRLTGPLIIALAVLWFGLIYQVVSITPDRGWNLYSNLNPVRFFAIFAVPLLLFVVFDLPASRADRNIGQGLNLFPLLFTINYLISAMVLAGFYFLGKLDLAGEGIVRVMTLSSLPAVFIIMRWGVGYARAVPTYLLVCNGLFFINTVYL